MFEVQALYDTQWENPATYTGDSADAFQHEDLTEALNHVTLLRREWNADDLRVVDLDCEYDDSDR